MGINQASAYLMASLFADVRDKPSKRILTLGLQDCMFTYEQACHIIRKAGVSVQHVPLAEVHFNETSALHGQAERRLIHQKTLFRMLGFDEAKVKALDASAYEHADHVWDLNRPIPLELRHSQDIVFDGGTLEHVFSVKDAFANVKDLLALGGLALHLNPADHVGHGLYCFSAGLYEDFYTANGFDRMRSMYIGFAAQPNTDRYFLELEPTKVGWSVAPYYTLYSLGLYRKTAEIPLVVPQQSLYAKLWGEASKPTNPSEGFFRKAGKWAAFVSPALSAAPLALYQIRKGRRVRLT